MLSASWPKRKADFRRLLWPSLLEVADLYPTSRAGTCVVKEQGVTRHGRYHNRNAFEIDTRTSNSRHPRVAFSAFADEERMDRYS